ERSRAENAEFLRRRANIQMDLRLKSEWYKEEKGPSSTITPPPPHPSLRHKLILMRNFVLPLPPPYLPVLVHCFETNFK
ncbi:hypothetical protein J6590_018090, partial [Homalodisca vitripennis]